MQSQFQDSWNGMIDKLSNWLDLIITNLPNLILAIVIFLGAYYLSQYLNTWLNKVMLKRVKQTSIRTLIANVLSITVIAIGLFLSMSILNLDKALSSILAGAGVAGLAVGLALQGTLSNTFSGIFLAVRDIMNIGDFIETNGYSGTVESINLRFLKIREPDNNMVIIPNKMVVENPFKNYGLTQKILTTINCGVGYESDLQKTKQIATKAINGLFPQENEPLEFQYLEFGDSSINFQIRFWVQATKNITLLEAKSQAIMALKIAFDNNGINIPYPIRTVISSK